MKPLVFIIAMLIFHCFAHADSKKKDECLDFHVIKNEPLGYQNDSGEMVGVHWEYLEAIEQASGLCINKRLIPYLRIWRSLTNGDHDAGILFRSKSRADIVEYSSLVREVYTVVVPVKGMKINHYDDLQHLIIGKPRGTHLGDKFDNDKNLTIVELNSYQQAAKMLQKGRIDAIAGSGLVINYQLKKYKAFDKIDNEGKFIVGKKEQWLQFSKKSKHLDLIPKLNLAIEELKQNGRLDAIMDKYYGKDWY